MTWEHWIYALAGAGAVAVIGLVPICGGIYWFVTTYATQRWVIEQLTAIVSNWRDRERDLREDVAAISARTDRNEIKIQEAALSHRDLKASTDSLTSAVRTLNGNIEWIMKRLAGDRERD